MTNTHPEKLSRAKGYFLSASGHTELCRAAFIGYLKNSTTRNTDAIWIALTNNICFALEAALKSFLCLKKIDEKTSIRRKYGHDLKKLYDTAVENNLSDLAEILKEKEFCEVLTKIIDLFGKDYATFNYRYIEEAELNVNTNKKSIEMCLLCLKKFNDYLSNEVSREK